jgi:hypothetical protein
MCGSLPQACVRMACKHELACCCRAEVWCAVLRCPHVHIVRYMAQCRLQYGHVRVAWCWHDVAARVSFCSSLHADLTLHCR